MLCVFFEYTVTTEIDTYMHTLALHDALPIYPLAGRSRPLAPDEGDLCRGDGIGLCGKQLGGVLRGFGRAQLGEAEHLPDIARPHQVAHQFGHAHQPAAVVAQVDDDFGHALRLELAEGIAQLVCRGIDDEGAQIEIADLLAAIVEDLDPVTV